MANNGRTKLFGDGADIINLFLPQGALGAEGFFDNADAGGGNDTVQGNLADNVLNGQSGADKIFGSFGKDTINGGSGGDTLDGQEDADVVHGNGGNDKVTGGSGNDTLHGDAGEDTLNGGSGKDTMHGGTSNDKLNGGDGNDTMNGGGANDTLKGEFGDDTLNGDDGNDTLQGGDGADKLNGGAGNDTIATDTASQLLVDNDIAHGNAGNDTISSFTGIDKLFGDAGNDTFIIRDFGRLNLGAVTVDGGSGTDKATLNNVILPVFNLGDVLPMWNKFTGVERLDIESDSGNQTLAFTFNNVRNMSDTDVLTIDGDVGDTVSLFNIVSGDVFSGGVWREGADVVIGGETFDVFNYDAFGPTGTIATVRIDNDIGTIVL